MLIIFHPNNPIKDKKTRAIVLFKRAISLIVLVAFIVTNIDSTMAQEAFSAKSASTLRPTNRFDPIADTKDEKLLLMGDFRDQAEFLYINKVIRDATALQITEASEVIAWIGDDLNGREFADFDYRKLYRKGDSFYLPIKDKDGRDVLMRYFRLKGDEASPNIIKLTSRLGTPVGLEFIGKTITPPEPAAPSTPSVLSPSPAGTGVSAPAPSVPQIETPPMPDIVKPGFASGLDQNIILWPFRLVAELWNAFLRLIGFGAIPAAAPVKVRPKPSATSAGIAENDHPEEQPPDEAQNRLFYKRTEVAVTDKTPLGGKVIILDLDNLIMVWQDKKRHQELRVRTHMRETIKSLRDKGAEVVVVTGANSRGAKKALQKALGDDLLNEKDPNPLINGVYSYPEGRDLGVNLKKYREAMDDFGKIEDALRSRDVLVVGHNIDDDVPWDIVERGDCPVFVQMDKLEYGKADHISAAALETIIGMLHEASGGDFKAGFANIYNTTTASTKRVYLEITSHRAYYGNYIKTSSAGNFAFKMSHIFPEGEKRKVPLIYDIALKPDPGQARRPRTASVMFILISVLEEWWASLFRIGIVAPGFGTPAPGKIPGREEYGRIFAGLRGSTSAPGASKESPVEGGMASLDDREKWIKKANSGDEDAAEKLALHVMRAEIPDRRQEAIAGIAGQLNVAASARFLEKVSAAHPAAGLSPTFLAYITDIKNRLGISRADEARILKEGRPPRTVSDIIGRKGAGWLFGVLRASPVALEDIKEDAFNGDTSDKILFVEMLCKAGFIKIRRAEYASACRYFDNASRLDPRNSYAWHYYGVANYNRAEELEDDVNGSPTEDEKRYLEKALSCFDRALALHPVNIAIMARRAEALRKLHRFGEAEEHAKAALQRCEDRDGSERLTVDLLNCLGYIGVELAKAGSAAPRAELLETAIIRFEKALQIMEGMRSENGLARTLSGLVYAHLSYVVYYCAKFDIGKLKMHYTKAAEANRMLAGIGEEKLKSHRKSENQFNKTHEELKRSLRAFERDYKVMEAASLSAFLQEIGAMERKGALFLGHDRGQSKHEKRPNRPGRRPGLAMSESTNLLYDLFARAAHRLAPFLAILTCVASGSKGFGMFGLGLGIDSLMLSGIAPHSASLTSTVFVIAAFIAAWWLANKLFKRLTTKERSEPEVKKLYEDSIGRTRREEIRRGFGSREVAHLRRFIEQMGHNNVRWHDPVRVDAVYADADWTLSSPESENMVRPASAADLAWLLGNGTAVRIATGNSYDTLPGDPVKDRIVGPIWSAIKTTGSGGISNLSVSARSGAITVRYGEDGHETKEGPEQVFSDMDSLEISRCFAEALLTEIEKVLGTPEIDAYRKELTGARNAKEVSGLAQRILSSNGITRGTETGLQIDRSMIFLAFKDRALDSSSILEMAQRLIERSGKQYPGLQYFNGPYYAAVSLYSKVGVIEENLELKNRGGLSVGLGDGSDDRRFLIKMAENRSVMTLPVFVGPDSFLEEDDVLVNSSGLYVDGSERILHNIRIAQENRAPYMDLPFIRNRWSPREVAEAYGLDLEEFISLVSDRLASPEGVPPAPGALATAKSRKPPRPGISDTGIFEHEAEVHKVIDSNILEDRGELTVTVDVERNETAAFDVKVVKGVDHLWRGEGKDGKTVIQKAHAGIERNTLYIAERAYSKTLLQHEAVELWLWQNKAMELVGLRNALWADLAERQRSDARDTLRAWQSEDPTEAYALARKFHDQAEELYPTFMQDELIVDSIAPILPSPSAKKLASFIIEDAKRAASGLGEIPPYALVAIKNIGTDTFIHELKHMLRNLTHLQKLRGEAEDTAIQKKIDELEEYVLTTRAWQLVLSNQKWLSSLEDPRIIFALVDGLIKHVENVIRASEELEGEIKRHDIGANYFQIAVRIKDEALLNLKLLDTLKGQMLGSEEQYRLVKINESMSEVIEKYNKNDKVEIELRFTENLPDIYSNPIAMSFVWSNLLTNAVDSIFEAIEAGEIEEGRIVITTRLIREEDDIFVEVAVSDNGKGIPPESLGRIFKEGETTKEGGSGMGLAIIDGIVKGLAGTIKAASPSPEFPARGATFTIRLLAGPRPMGQVGGVPRGDAQDLTPSAHKKTTPPGLAMTGPMAALVNMLLRAAERPQGEKEKEKEKVISPPKEPSAFHIVGRLLLWALPVFGVAAYFYLHAYIGFVFMQLDIVIFALIVPSLLYGIWNYIVSPLLNIFETRKTKKDRVLSRKAKEEKRRKAREEKMAIRQASEDEVRNAKAAGDMTKQEEEATPAQANVAETMRIETALRFIVSATSSGEITARYLKDKDPRVREAARRKKNALREAEQRAAYDRALQEFGEAVDGLMHKITTYPALTYEPELTEYYEMRQRVSGMVDNLQIQQAIDAVESARGKIFYYDLKINMRIKARKIFKELVHDIQRILEGDDVESARAHLAGIFAFAPMGAIYVDEIDDLSEEIDIYEALQEAEEYFELGLEFEERGEKLEALAAYKETLKLNPGHEEAKEKTLAIEDILAKEKEAQELVHRALRHAQEGDYRTAFSTFRGVVDSGYSVDQEAISLCAQCLLEEAEAADIGISGNRAEIARMREALLIARECCIASHKGNPEYNYDEIIGRLDGFIKECNEILAGESGQFQNGPARNRIPPYAAGPITFIFDAGVKTAVKIGVGLHTVLFGRPKKMVLHRNIPRRHMLRSTKRSAQSFDGARISYEMIGNGPTPMVFLHYMFGTKERWHRFIKELMKSKFFRDRFTFVLIDLRGFGESELKGALWKEDRRAIKEAIGDDRWSFRRNYFKYCAHDIEGVLEDAGFGKRVKAHILGHSLGGMVAIQFAMDFQPRVEKLVLVHTSSDPINTFTPLRFFPWSSRIIQQLLEITGYTGEMGIHKLGDTMLEAWLERAIEDADLMRVKVFDSLLKAPLFIAAFMNVLRTILLDGHNHRVVEEILRDVRDTHLVSAIGVLFAMAHLRYTPDELMSIKCPTLIVRGRWDNVTARPTYWGKYMWNVEFVEVKGKHMSPQEHPSDLARVLRQDYKAQGSKSKRIPGKADMGMGHPLFFWALMLANIFIPLISYLVFRWQGWRIRGKETMLYSAKPDTFYAKTDPQEIVDTPGLIYAPALKDDFTTVGSMIKTLRKADAFIFVDRKYEDIALTGRYIYWNCRLPGAKITKETSGVMGRGGKVVFNIQYKGREFKLYFYAEDVRGFVPDELRAEGASLVFTRDADKYLRHDECFLMHTLALAKIGAIIINPDAMFHHIIEAHEGLGLERIFVGRDAPAVARTAYYNLLGGSRTFRKVEEVQGGTTSPSPASGSPRNRIPPYAMTGPAALIASIVGKTINVMGNLIGVPASSAVPSPDGYREMQNSLAETNIKRESLATELRLWHNIVYRTFLEGHISAVGFENLPEEGFLLAPNHASFVDPTLLNSILWERSLQLPLFVADMANIDPLQKWVVRRGLGLPVVDGGTVENMVKALRAGRIVGIFPGARPNKTLNDNLRNWGRSKIVVKDRRTGRLHPIEKEPNVGLARASIGSGKPIVPTLLIPQETAQDEYWKWDMVALAKFYLLNKITLGLISPKFHLTVIFGKPIYPEQGEMPEVLMGRWEDAVRALHEDFIAKPEPVLETAPETAPAHGQVGDVPYRAAPEAKGRNGGDELGLYTNIKKYKFVKRYTEIVEQEKGEKIGVEGKDELSRFRKLIPKLFKLKRIRNCYESASEVFKLLKRNDFDVQLRRVYFDADEKDDYIAHAYNVVTLAGVKFILDLTAEQFGDPSQPYQEVMLLPSRVAFEHRERLDFYFLGKEDSGPTYVDIEVISEGLRKGYRIDYAGGEPVEIQNQGLDDFIAYAKDDIDPRVSLLAKTKPDPTDTPMRGSDQVGGVPKFLDPSTWLRVDTEQGRGIGSAETMGSAHGYAPLALFLSALIAAGIFVSPLFFPVVAVGIAIVVYVGLYIKLLAIYLNHKVLKEAELDTENVWLLPRGAYKPYDFNYYAWWIRKVTVGKGLICSGVRLPVSALPPEMIGLEPAMDHDRDAMNSVIENYDSFSPSALYMVRYKKTREVGVETLRGLLELDYYMYEVHKLLNDMFSRADKRGLACNGLIIAFEKAPLLTLKETRDILEGLLSGSRFKKEAMELLHAVDVVIERRINNRNITQVYIHTDRMTPSNRPPLAIVESASELIETIWRFLAWVRSAASSLFGWPVTSETTPSAAKAPSEPSPSTPIITSTTDLSKAVWYSRTATVALRDGSILALKFLKRGEDTKEWEGEATTLKELNDKGLGVPLPLRNNKGGSYVFTYKGALTNAPPTADIDPSHRYIAYITKPEYFIYPEDIKDKDRMSILSRNAFRQLAELMKAGYIHTSLTPLTHAVSRQRTWQWNWTPIGGIENLTPNLAHSNIRLSGLADYAHVRDIKPTDYLYYNMGQALSELIVTITYHSLKNGVREKAILNMLKDALNEYYTTIGIKADIGSEKLEKLRSFIKLCGIEIDSNEFSSGDDGNIRTIDNLVDFIRYALGGTVKSKIYESILPRSLRVEDIARGSVIDLRSMVKDGEALYVADGGKCCIVKIDLKDGSHEDIAKGSVIDPWSMVKDGDILYIGDSGKHCIVKINLKDGSHEEFAKGSVIYPRSMVKDGGALYVADSGKGCIVKINLKDGSHEDIAKGSAIHLRSMVKDGEALYVADSDKGCIVKIVMPSPSAPLYEVGMAELDVRIEQGKDDGGRGGVTRDKRPDPKKLAAQLLQASMVAPSGPTPETLNEAVVNTVMGNRPLVEDLADLGYRPDDVARKLARSAEDTNHLTAFGFTDNLAVENQMKLLKAHYRLLINEKASKNDRGLNIVEIGLGGSPKESVEALKAFYEEIRAAGEDPKLWSIRLYGIDYNESALDAADKKLASPVNRRDTSMARSLGIDMDGIALSVKLIRANTFDSRSIEDGLRGVEADIVFARHTTYPNYYAMRGVFTNGVKSVVVKNAPSEKDYENLCRLLKSYLETRNILLTAGREASSSAMGTLYIVEPIGRDGFFIEDDEWQNASQVYLPPGTTLCTVGGIINDIGKLNTGYADDLFASIRDLNPSGTGMLRLTDKKALAEAGLYSFQESIRSSMQAPVGSDEGHTMEITSDGTKITGMQPLAIAPGEYAATPKEPPLGDALKLVIIGAPASGKGTFAKRIAKRYGLSHISLGEAFRDEILRGTELGKEVERFVNSGELVPDDIIFRVLKEKLKNGGGNGGFILDGIPRTHVQAVLLDAMLSENGMKLDGVINLKVSDKVLDQRTIKRIEDAKSEGQPSRKDDDLQVAVERRMSFKKRASELLSYYERQGKCYDVDASGALDENMAKIEDTIKTISGDRSNQSDKEAVARGNTQPKTETVPSFVAETVLDANGQASNEPFPEEYTDTRTQGTGLGLPSEPSSGTLHEITTQAIVDGTKAASVPSGPSPEGSMVDSRGSIVDSTPNPDLSPWNLAPNSAEHGTSPKAVQTTRARLTGNKFDEYKRHLTGVMPTSLRSEIHLLTWPIDMTNPSAELVGFYGEKNWLDPTYDKVHRAIDIRTHAGDIVSIAQDGKLVFVANNLIWGLTFYVYSAESKILYMYAHISQEGLPEKIYEAIRPVLKSFNLHMKIDVDLSEGETLGQVKSWPRLADNGLTADHLHFGIYFILEGKLPDLPNPDYEETLPAINPLVLLEKLSDIPSKIEFSDRFNAFPYRITLEDLKPKIGHLTPLTLLYDDAPPMALKDIQPDERPDDYFSVGDHLVLDVKHVHKSHHINIHATSVKGIVADIYRNSVTVRVVSDDGATQSFGFSEEITSPRIWKWDQDKQLFDLDAQPAEAQNNDGNLKGVPTEDTLPKPIAASIESTPAAPEEESTVHSPQSMVDSRGPIVDSSPIPGLPPRDPTPSAHIRPAEDKDAAAIYNLQERHLEGKERFYSVDDYKRTISNSMTDDVDHSIWVYDKDGIIGGYLLSFYAKDSRATYIEEMAVTESLRHRGIGKALFARAIEEARRSRSVKIYIDAGHPDSASIARHFGLTCRFPHENGTGFYEGTPAYDEITPRRSAPPGTDDIHARLVEYTRAIETLFDSVMRDVYGSNYYEVHCYGCSKALAEILREVFSKDGIKFEVLEGETIQGDYDMRFIKATLPDGREYMVTGSNPELPGRICVYDFEEGVEALNINRQPVYFSPDDYSVRFNSDRIEEAVRRFRIADRQRIAGDGLSQDRTSAEHITPEAERRKKELWDEIHLKGTKLFVLFCEALKSLDGDITIPRVRSALNRVKERVFETAGEIRDRVIEITVIEGDFDKYARLVASSSTPDTALCDEITNELILAAKEAGVPYDEHTMEVLSVERAHRYFILNGKEGTIAVDFASGQFDSMYKHEVVVEPNAEYYPKIFATLEAWLAKRRTPEFLSRIELLRPAFEKVRRDYLDGIGRDAQERDYESAAKAAPETSAMPEPGKTAPETLNEAVVNTIMGNRPLVEDLADLGYRPDDVARKLARSAEDTNHLTAFGFTDNLAVENQMKLLKAHYRLLINEKASKNDRGLNIVEIGLGGSPKESVEALKAFYEEIHAAGEDPKLWSIRLYGIDYTEVAIDAADKKLASPVNRRDTSMARSLGIDMDGIDLSVKLIRANAFDSRSIEDGLRGVEADIVFARHTTYPNYYAMRGVFTNGVKSVVAKNAPSEKDYENLCRLLKSYLETRNILLTAGREASSSAMGTLYIVEPIGRDGFFIEDDEWQNASQVYLPPGTTLSTVDGIINDIRKLNAAYADELSASIRDLNPSGTGILQLTDKKALAAAGLYSFQKSIRNSIGEEGRGKREDTGVALSKTSLIAPVTERPVELEVESFSGLLRSHFSGQRKICGFDFGAGIGVITKNVIRILNTIFSEVDFVGLDNNPVIFSMPTLDPSIVQYYDTRELMDSYDERRKYDLITIFNPYPGTLNDLVSAAKHVVKEDGLVFISLLPDEMQSLLGGSTLNNAITAEDAWVILSDFKLVKIKDTKEGNRPFLRTDYALLYSPKWQQAGAAPLKVEIRETAPGEAVTAAPAPSGPSPIMLVEFTKDQIDELLPLVKWQAVFAIGERIRPAVNLLIGKIYPLDSIDAQKIGRFLEKQKDRMEAALSLGLENAVDAYLEAGRYEEPLRVEFYVTKDDGLDSIIIQMVTNGVPLREAEDTAGKIKRREQGIARLGGHGLGMDRMRQFLYLLFSEFLPQRHEIMSLKDRRETIGDKDGAVLEITVPASTIHRQLDYWLQSEEPSKTGAILDKDTLAKAAPAPSAEAAPSAPSSETLRKRLPVRREWDDIRRGAAVGYFRELVGIEPSQSDGSPFGKQESLRVLNNAAGPYGADFIFYDAHDDLGPDTLRYEAYLSIEKDDFSITLVEEVPIPLGHGLMQYRDRLVDLIGNFAKEQGLRFNNNIQVAALQPPAAASGESLAVAPSLEVPNEIASAPEFTLSEANVASRNDDYAQYKKSASIFVNKLKRLAFTLRSKAAEKPQEKVKEESDAIIIAVETEGYIPVEQESAIQPLLRELANDRLGKYFADIQLDNVRFVHGKCEALKKALLDEKQDSRASPKNIIVLGTKGTIAMLANIEELKGETEDDGAFFAEMDTANISGLRYIPISEMLTIALSLAYGGRTRKYPNVEIEPTANKRHILLRPIERVECNNLPTIYKKQAEILQAA